ncbi:hypothetical protein F2Q70_00031998 [Brassica cretica]|uniref:Uncharacterized protein n=1 Tax=Brassica cretica TaxID=69181 RepID=A0A8S9FER4_BRACR|nr:hypothetical protein F2Q70_00031998 [Brassica cretica]
MLTTRSLNLSRHCSRTCKWSLSSLLQSDSSRNLVLSSNPVTSNAILLQPGSSNEVNSSSLMHQVFKGWSRAMSTSRGRSMRSKVESRMRKESGKTLREIRRAKKLKKKLMTDEERLIYNLKRELSKFLQFSVQCRFFSSRDIGFAKKKVALLLQKLKKYDLPELPSPVHDPELFTLRKQSILYISYKKILLPIHLTIFKLILH